MHIFYNIGLNTNEKFSKKLSCLIIFSVFLICVFFIVINLQSNKSSLKQSTISICSNDVNNDVNIKQYSNLADMYQIISIFVSLLTNALKSITI